MIYKPLSCRKGNRVRLIKSGYEDTQRKERDESLTAA
jgi:hypothetical protein